MAGIESVRVLASNCQAFCLRANTAAGAVLPEIAPELAAVADDVRHGLDHVLYDVIAPKFGDGGLASALKDSYSPGFASSSVLADRLAHQALRAVRSAVDNLDNAGKAIENVGGLRTEAAELITGLQAVLGVSDDFFAPTSQARAAALSV